MFWQYVVESLGRSKRVIAWLLKRKNGKKKYKKRNLNYALIYYSNYFVVFSYIIYYIK